MPLAPKQYNRSEAMTGFSRLFAAAELMLPLKIGAFGAKAEEADIFVTADSAGDFKTLVAAVKAAGLEETLGGERPFSAFAPSDDAFAELPDCNLDLLLKPENKEQLVPLQSFHVIGGKVTVADIGGKVISFETLDGEKVKVHSVECVAVVNQAAIKQPDIMAWNGVIRLIDKLIWPE